MSLSETNQSNAATKSPKKGTFDLLGGLFVIGLMVQVSIAAFVGYLIKFGVSFLLQKMDAAAWVFLGVNLVFALFCTVLSIYFVIMLYLKHRSKKFLKSIEVA